MATGENQQTLSPLWQSPLRSRTPSGLRYVCLGHTLTLVSMECFSVVRQSAGKPTRPFLCGGRDLLGQCRGLEGDVLPCASHGAWCNLLLRSFVSHIAIFGTAPVNEPGAERESGARPSPYHLI